ncbi:hypothetical protein ACTXN4_22880, partial [Pseudomonas helleri]
KLSPTEPLESSTYFMFDGSELVSRSLDVEGRQIAAFVPCQRLQSGAHAQTKKSPATERARG